MESLLPHRALLFATERSCLAASGVMQVRPRHCATSLLDPTPSWPPIGPRHGSYKYGLFTLGRLASPLHSFPTCSSRSCPTSRVRASPSPRQLDCVLISHSTRSLLSRILRVLYRCGRDANHLPNAAIGGSSGSIAQGELASMRIFPEQRAPGIQLLSLIDSPHVSARPYAIWLPIHRPMH